MRLLLYICVFACSLLLTHASEELVSRVDSSKYTVAKEVSYLLYDVNRGEGFNLRRDVYMRVANSVQELRKNGENFHLVLPPWGGLPHWKDRALRQRWSQFFDLRSLNGYVPVIEFEEWLNGRSTSPSVDQIVYMQHFQEGFGTEFTYKNERRKCIDGRKYYQKEGELWKGWFFSYPEVYAKKFYCVSFQGDSKYFARMILTNYTKQESLFFERAETMLHKDYAGREFWKVRRSMRYAEKLLRIAAHFREKELDSTNEKDNSELPANWEEEKKRETAAKGGPYICAHWRRRDFVRSLSRYVPSVKGTARQLKSLAARYKLTRVFLATDAEDSDLSELRKQLPSDLSLVLFRGELEKGLNDGQKAIVEQIICAHSRHFVGTHVSTFSFRIQEDREILGFDRETTFNVLLPDEGKLEQPAKWIIKY